MHDREGAGGAGQGRVEPAAAAVGLLGEDRRRLDDDGGVELEALDRAEAEQVDAGGQARVALLGVGETEGGVDDGAGGLGSRDAMERGAALYRRDWARPSRAS